jgi:hypothetical protein
MENLEAGHSGMMGSIISLRNAVIAGIVAEVVRLRFLPLRPEVSRLRLLLAFRDVAIEAGMMGSISSLRNAVVAGIVAEVVRLRFLPLRPEVSRLRLLLAFRDVAIEAGG